jgi:hypothetical protein
VSGGETPGEESKQDEQDSKQKNAQQAPNQSQSVPQMQGNNNPNNGTQTPVTP